MTYFAVRSGSMFRCVRAEGPVEACVEAVGRESKEKHRDGRTLGIVCHVAELNQDSMNTHYVLTKLVLEKGSVPYAVESEGRE